MENQEQLIKFLEDNGIQTIERLQEFLEPSYFAVIPMDILENPELSSTAKLLYAEILALSKKSGRCFATNGYLSKRIGMSERTVSRAVKELDKYALICAKLNKNNDGTFRDITLTYVGGRQCGNRGRHLVKKDRQLVDGGIPDMAIHNRNREVEINKDIYMPIYVYFQKMINKNSALTDKAIDKIKSRLKRYSEVELRRAMENFSKSEWWMKNNAGRGVAWFFNSDDRIDQFLNLEEVKQNNGRSIIK